MAEAQSVRCNILHCQSGQGDQVPLEPLRQRLESIVRRSSWDVDVLEFNPSTRIFEAVFLRRNGDLSSEAFFDLCDALCGADLEGELADYMKERRELGEPQLKLQLVQSPTMQRTVNDVDNHFANCFSITTLERYCTPDNMLSKRLEANKNAFFGRNPTKYIQHGLVGLHTAAEVTEKCNAYIYGICAIVDHRIGGPSIRQRWACDRVSGRSNDEENKLLALATAEPIQKLNSLVILYRLREIRETFLWASRAPQQALNNLANTGESLDPKLVVAVINSFGPLMQCLIPLFDTTLYITDADFTTVAAYSGGAAVSVAVAVALVFAPFTGPLAIGACAVAGGMSGWTSVAAIREGIAWGKKQELDPSFTLLAMLKNMEESLLYLRAMGCAGSSFDSVDHQRVRDQIQLDSTTTPFTPEQCRAYVQNQAQELEDNLQKLRVGLDDCDKELCRRSRVEREAQTSSD
ncbi:hypothetical protein KCU78_g6838, partial [Aureobasidium melanogenum]